jgi:aminoglycoside phosphotransferase (APT) family kinase protein
MTIVYKTQNYSGNTRKHCLRHSDLRFGHLIADKGDPHATYIQTGLADRVC